MKYINLQEKQMPKHLEDFNKKLLNYELATKEFKTALRDFKEEDLKAKAVVVRQSLSEGLASIMKFEKKSSSPETAHLKPVKTILKRINTRKYGYCAEKLHNNLCLVFGTEPAKSVLADTTMVNDIVSLLDSEYDKDNLKI
jgi:RNA polymerase-binding transcription factor DksA